MHARSPISCTCLGLASFGAEIPRSPKSLPIPPAKAGRCFCVQKVSSLARPSTTISHLPSTSCATPIQDRNILSTLYLPQVRYGTVLCDYNQAQSRASPVRTSSCDRSPLGSPKAPKPTRTNSTNMSPEAIKKEESLLNGEETDYIGRRPSSSGRDTKRISQSSDHASLLEEHSSSWVPLLILQLPARLAPESVS